MYIPQNPKKGFTLPELSIVVGVVVLLTSLALVNLGSIQNRTYLTTTLNTFQADYAQQHISAMAGNTEGAASAQSYGIYFDTNSYTLFRGNTYSPSNTTNFVVDLEGGMEFTTVDLPQSEIIFAPGSGNVSNYSPTQNTLTIRNAITGEQVTITINRFGIITGIN